VVIHDFDLVCTVCLPDEAGSPLIVDTDAVLTFLCLVLYCLHVWLLGLERWIRWPIPRSLSSHNSSMARKR
jgi:hypothetical protein